ncbi:cupin domain-containing protein [Methylobacterium terrae]|uniref:Cupin domain-containing protein n=1 Tax=Methylobacterium terrae TaxID=2202827 RepID=A0A2U8WSJ6_9HYPH|nr:cupin domain-containing protein [Methylobacterium terrae]AWN49087.1 cupin domain-containing protein [Methylobacterium terrae]
MGRRGQVFTRGAEVAWEPAGAGVRRQVLAYDDGVMLVRVAFEAGAVGPAHSHPHVQCTLVERGVFDVTIAGETARLVAGDTFLVPSGAIHSAVAVEAGALTDVFTPMREEFVPAAENG